MIRLCTLIGVLVLLGFRVVWQLASPTMVDPLAARLVIVGVVFGVFTATLLPQRLTRIVPSLYLGACILLGAWMAWLCALNRFDGYSTVGLTLVAMSAGCTLRSYRSFALFQGSMLAVGLATATTTNNPIIHPGFVALSLFTIAVAEFIALHARVYAQEALKKSESLMHTVFAEAADGLVVLDSEGEVVRANDRLLRMLGIDDPAEVEKLLPIPLGRQATGRESISDRLEMSTVASNGSRLWVDVVFRYLNDDVQPLWLARMSDITARKNMEQAIERARDEAERASRAKARFLATMSHEIRTPMNGVIGMASLLKETNLDTEQSSFVDTLEKSSQTLLSIINEILDFSKIEAGRIELEMSDGKPRDIVYDVLELLAASASEKGLELIGDIAPSVPAVVSCDVTRLQQVLTNLVGNAVKFTTHGQIRVHLTSTRTSSSEALLKFSIEDTGPGITREQQKRLFRNFSQADPSHHRRYGGTGLGLAISKRLAELMGGTVEVQSEAGKGSTFSFTVRTQVVAQDNADCVVLEPLQGRTVLLAIANDSLSLSLKRSLETWGADVLRARSAPEVEDELARRPPVDVLVVEDEPSWGMGAAVFQSTPVESGYTAVLVLTGLSRRRLLEVHGAVSTVTHKPVRPRDLRRSLITLVGGESPITDVTTRPRSVTDSPDGLQGLRVLLAEDNRVNRRVAEQMLTRLGCEVSSVTNGVEAIQAIRTGHFHVVLMDVQMPEMDGLTATRDLRRLYNRHALPIVAMTANATKEDRTECLEAGMNDHLPKPIRLSDLRDALVHYVRPPSETSTA